MTTLSQYKKGNFLFRQGDASDRVLQFRERRDRVLREVGATSVLLGHVQTASGWARWASSRAAAAARRHGPLRTAN